MTISLTFIGHLPSPNPGSNFCSQILSHAWRILNVKLQNCLGYAPGQYISMYSLFDIITRPPIGTRQIFELYYKYIGREVERKCS